MKRKAKKRLKLHLRTYIFLVTGVLLAGLLWLRLNNSQPIVTAPFKLNTPDKVEEEKEKPGFDKAQHSLNDSSSPWVIVNKGRQLPSSYVPQMLRTPNIPLRGTASDANMKLTDVAAAALENMNQAAARDGVNLKLTSGYRSYNTQISVYNAEVRTNGQAQADKQSARPGHSEHQTGLAIDLEPTNGQCRLSQCFASTAEGIWVKNNAHKYGFIVRYPEGKEGLTGYSFEPWHLRYVGTELASEISSLNQTLEQFFELPFFPTYPDEIFKLSPVN